MSQQSLKEVALDVLVDEALVKEGVELNFDIADEPKSSKGPDDGMCYPPMEE